ncbi:MAG: ABC transporter ATP-binding protein [Alphaproteobacteria bacterium]|nr:ABC transporter ATP-binding protein [Alphaproteobacteria bacterium]MBV9151244.1 ABC transporter ATP-binding protein [Alphaproteobacteria bacterium]MBV9587302.1 ABC transporter ATP-binding protein [Alphaproteobacteria bacterium]MBV9964859.1 ABC transporter ATP-binding protein [Alphaproteobacteria bacterium]
MLEIRHLVKKFGPLAAVDDVSFEVAAGEVLGFLGPNGAGKSTTMKMITGFLAPTSGTAVICGHDIQSEPLAAKRRIGYLPEGAPAYPDMTGAEFLDFIAHIRGLRGAEARRRIAYIAGLIHIADVMQQPIDTLSKGYRRRVGVAQALLHDPAVLVLDEPTDGLDPNQKYEMRGIIRDLSPQKAIVISTHLLEEVEAVCSRAMIIARGRILADGTPSELAARSRFHNAVRIDFAAAEVAAFAAELRQLPGVTSVEASAENGDASLCVFSQDGQPLSDSIVRHAREQGWPVTGLYVERGRLDDVFRRITAPEPNPEPLRVAA